jgi:hypothetical protein
MESDLWVSDTKVDRILEHNVLWATLIEAGRQLTKSTGPALADLIPSIDETGRPATAVQRSVLEG